MHGWPSSFKELSHDLCPFVAMREGFVVENGLIFRGQRLLIPSSLQSYCVTQLHQGHPSLEAKKRMYSDIEYSLVVLLAMPSSPITQESPYSCTMFLTFLGCSLLLTYLNGMAKCTWF